MNETRLHSSLRTVCKDLSDSRAAYALVGGLAVSARTEPRFTKDVDLAVAAASDREAEALVGFLRSRQYRIQALVEHETAARLATVRLTPPTEPFPSVDLLFASSGIEAEIVAAAEPLNVIEGLVVPVATVGHLIATKVLSRDDAQRPQDRVDLIALLHEAGEADLRVAREALRTMDARGFSRGKDLLTELESMLQ